LKSSRDIASSVDKLLDNVPGQHSTSVYQYRYCTTFARYHKDLGTLAYLEVHSDEQSNRVKQRILWALKHGMIGRLRVTASGFEFHVVRGLTNLYMRTQTALRRSFSVWMAAALPLTSDVMDIGTAMMDPMNRQNMHIAVPQLL
ncbi:unnamed protein product, partial [Strongylus vulgaris]